MTKKTVVAKSQRLPRSVEHQDRMWTERLKELNAQHEREMQEVTADLDIAEARLEEMRLAHSTIVDKLLEKMGQS